MESERATRQARIDPKLASAGWRVVPFAHFSPTGSADAVEEFPTSLGPADYVLSQGGDELAVVEAKKLTVGAQGVLPQAERYAKVIPSEEPYQGRFGVPFLYSTNGEQIV